VADVSRLLCMQKLSVTPQGPPSRPGCVGVPTAPTLAQPSLRGSASARAEAAATARSAWWLCSPLLPRLWVMPQRWVWGMPDAATACCQASLRVFAAPCPLNICRPGSHAAAGRRLEWVLHQPQCQQRSSLRSRGRQLPSIQRQGVTACRWAVCRPGSLHAWRKLCVHRRAAAQRQLYNQCFI
jgi:hypothetical protein